MEALVSTLNTTLNATVAVHAHRIRGGPHAAPDVTQLLTQQFYFFIHGAVAVFIAYFTGFLRTFIDNIRAFFWGRTRVSLRAETPDELFVWLNRYLISLPAFGTLTQLDANATAADIAAATKAGLNNSVVSPKSLKKSQIGGSGSSGSDTPTHPANTYFDSSELWSYKVCSEKVMLRDQGGYSAQMMSGGARSQQRARRYAISSSGAYINLDGESEADKRWSIVFLPGEGAGYSFYYKGVKIWVNSQIVDPKDKDKAAAAQTQYDPYTGEAMAAADSSKRVLTLSADVKHAQLLNEIVRDAIAMMRDGSDQKLGTYKPPNGHTATFFCQGEYTADTFCHPELPILPGNTVKSLLEDVDKFLKSEDFYKRMGVPYRRGYLFYGVPGTGKTTLVRKMAAAHKLDVCMVSLSNNIGVENYLQRLFSSAPHHSILLIEDIDVAFPRSDDDDLVGNRDDKNKDGVITDIAGFLSMGAGIKSSKKLSMSELFNAIDGIAAQTGCILVMTTNHIEHLDPALIRSGRIDVKIPFDYAERRECALAFHRYYPEMDLDVIDDAEIARLKKEEEERKQAEDNALRKLTRQRSAEKGLVSSTGDTKDAKADTKKSDTAMGTGSEPSPSGAADTGLRSRRGGKAGRGGRGGARGGDDKSKSADDKSTAKSGEEAESSDKASGGEKTSDKKADDKSSAAAALVAGKLDAVSLLKAAASGALPTATAGLDAPGAASKSPLDSSLSKLMAGRRLNETEEQYKVRQQKEAADKAFRELKEKEIKEKMEADAERARIRKEIKEKRAKQLADEADLELAARELREVKTPAEEERERIELGVSKLAYAFGKRAGRLTRKPRLTMSDIQGHLLKYRDTPQLAFSMLSA